MKQLITKDQLKKMPYKFLPDEMLDAFLEYLDLNELNHLTRAELLGRFETDYKEAKIGWYQDSFLYDGEKLIAHTILYKDDDLRVHENVQKLYIDRSDEAYKEANKLLENKRGGIYTVRVKMDEWTTMCNYLNNNGYVTHHGKTFNMKDSLQKLLKDEFAVIILDNKVCYTCVFRSPLTRGSKHITVNEFIKGEC